MKGNFKTLAILILVVAIAVAGCVKEEDQFEVVEEGPEEIPTAPSAPPPPAIEETTELPTETTSQPTEEQKPAPKLVNGKTMEERLQEAYNDLHNYNSALRVKENFPDLVAVYTDDGSTIPYTPREIFPFIYYYSEEANTTFNLCAVDRSVFICKGKLDRQITDEDLDSGRCFVTPIYGSSII